MPKNVTSDIEINQNILNIITPTGLDFKKSSFMLGENYAKCFVVSGYNSKPDFGWISKIVSIEGTIANIEFFPTESGPLIERCNEQIKDTRRSLSDIKDESVYQGKEQAIKDIADMITRINKDGEVVGYVNILLLVQAPTEEKLEERVKKVQATIGAIGGRTRCLSLHQREAYKVVTPYGLPNEKLDDIGFRNMPLSTFIGGFVNAQSGINDGIGFCIGKSLNGKPVILDTWRRGGDRTNSNWLITGIPGVGKSSLAKFIFELEYALGAKIIIQDPEREFVELALNMNGNVINCYGGKGGRINPLQVRKVPRIDSDEELDNVYQDEGKGISDLALHFQTLRIFHRLYKKDITDIEMDKLEEILEKTYTRKNIFWDTDITKLKNTDYPIYEDLYEDIEQAVRENPEDPDYKKLMAYFRSISKGADSFIWNGYTDLEITSDFIVLDTSALLESDENILRAQTHNINSWAWHQISEDRVNRVVYGVDEGYLIVDPENPKAIAFMKNVSKRIRKYEGSLVFITHSVADILDPSVKRYGQAIIDNACYKFIMGTDGKNLEETKALFNLTEAETALLLAKQRGKGLLYAGSVRIAAQIEIPEVFLNHMGRAGGR